MSPIDRAASCNVVNHDVIYVVHVCRGETFHEALLRVGDIRSLVPSGVNMMTLTATASRPLRTAVASILGMKNPFVVAVSPCKANIMYKVEDYESIEKLLEPFVVKLQGLRNRMPRVIFYCRSYNDSADIYLYFLDKLGSSFTEPVGAPNLSRFRLVDMFTSVTDQAVKKSIIASFVSINATLRIVVSTVAFGMGVDCSNVRQVVNVGQTLSRTYKKLVVQVEMDMHLLLFLYANQ